MKYKFADIAINSTAKKKPTEADKDTYLGLEHLDSGSLTVTRFGSDVAPIGEKLIMKKGDVLFGKRRAYQKKVAIAPFDGIFSAHGMVLRPNEAIVDRGFFPLFISSDYFLDAAIKISVGSLSPTINWSELKELEFNLPPIDEQRKLADLLWAAVEAKNAYKELLSKTDELVKAQFIELFGDPVMNPLGWNITTMRKASERLSDGPFGSNLKSEHYSDSGIRVIRLQNIGVGEYIDKDKAFIPEEHYQTIKKYTCKSGDIVIGTLGEPNLRACIIPDSIEFAINKADCVHYIPRKEILNRIFVCQYINYPSTLTLAMGSVHGNTRQRISSGQVAELPIFLPPIDLQNQFAAFVQQTDKSKLELQRTLDELHATYKALLRENLG